MKGEVMIPGRPAARRGITPSVLAALSNAMAMIVPATIAAAGHERKYHGGFVKSRARKSEICSMRETRERRESGKARNEESENGERRGGAG
jgi:hypothetical protein